MKEIKVRIEGIKLNFEKAKAIADILAEGTLIAWSDGEKHYPDVCCMCGDKPGWMVYGESRGNVKVEIDGYVFYYLSDERAEH
ncbi:AF1514 family protein [Archaeoglobus sp.]